MIRIKFIYDWTFQVIHEFKFQIRLKRQLYNS